ncbi:hypothetical protein CHH83_01775 [Bacillus sp. 7586-K]|nr:hypothetical protein CHH83_01775 [Bacillus sp. 7586-K]
MLKTGVTDECKDFLRQGLSNADDLVDDIRRSLEENVSIDEKTWRKYEDVLEKLSIKINEMKNEIDFL